MEPRRPGAPGPADTAGPLIASYHPAGFYRRQLTCFCSASANWATADLPFVAESLCHARLDGGLFHGFLDFADELVQFIPAGPQAAA